MRNRAVMKAIRRTVTVVIACPNPLIERSLTIGPAAQPTHAPANPVCGNFRCRVGIFGNIAGYRQACAALCKRADMQAPKDR
ncbi:MULTISPECIES: hypothetical protein [unclassified Novosphingobium]|uniref:hypothetical protein n=1 Tax=unclassified Novosphingobium TaxID=2644732 RepID=UPI0014945BB8|nr:MULTISPECIES: hypothetical protein [unclassified Novosphingobium]MBB3651713.1 hypothetical protein [Novosphingobium sp. BK626]MBB3373804.1 hypothetical protein [Novosphingobium sp. BK280]MBB3378216.1 hypothetical protein [Novosphingobium sp. BK258]MBB3419999.1 hypothetical protein [Novosphingobium sp. BK267]MBB3447679.1 hypothetical protein [Novosphingobium sp. BK352]